MFVVTDQHAGRIGGQRCLARAGQAKEHSRINRVAWRVVGRAMHRHDALFWQQVVQQRKHRFLVLASVFGAADQDQLAVKVQRDDGLRAAAMLGRVGFERGAVDDGEVRHEICQLGRLWAAQQVADEQAMPCKFGHNAHIKRCAGSAPPNKSCTS